MSCLYELRIFPMLGKLGCNLTPMEIFSLTPYWQRQEGPPWELILLCRIVV